MVALPGAPDPVVVAVARRTLSRPVRNVAISSPRGEDRSAEGPETVEAQSQSVCLPCIGRQEDVQGTPDGSKGSATDQSAALGTRIRPGDDQSGGADGPADGLRRSACDPMSSVQVSGTDHGAMGRQRGRYSAIFSPIFFISSSASALP